MSQGLAGRRSEKRVSREFAAKEFSPSTWPDFRTLFEKHRGVWGGCWCMYYHVARGWAKRSPSQNREDKEALVNQGKVHGVLIYHDDRPVGWCQFGPKAELPRIDNMRNYKQTGLDLWRITCFFVDKDYRGRGVAKAALGSALGTMKDMGVKLVEAYPVNTTGMKSSSSLLWSGTVKLFEEFGFRRIGPLGKNGFIVRKEL